MIHTKIFTKKERGLNLHIEPKLMTKPSGNAKTNVKANSFSVSRNPSKRARVTVRNMIYPFKDNSMVEAK